MAGIYIHIPFCKQACSYCDFHFTTLLKNKSDLITAILKELELRREYLNESVKSIYFGGGTPSILTTPEIEQILNKIHALFNIDPNIETTLEGNPDDLNLEKLKSLKSIGINRLSVGIQSFFEADLKFMNRAHSNIDSLNVIKNLSTAQFNNYTIDLIYGSPVQSDEQWVKNLNYITQFEIPHFSAYSLTVEPKTVLADRIKKGKTPPVSDKKTAKHFEILMEFAEKNNYDHYEISNLCKEGYRAKHNYAYWEGKNYLGIGPSAHSYNGSSRQWNVSNNSVYVRAIGLHKIPCTHELLTEHDRYNESVLTKLRITTGINLEDLTMVFSPQIINHFEKEIEKWISKGLVRSNNSTYSLTKQGKFFADQIASDLFYLA